MSDGSGQSTGQPPGNTHLPWHLIPPFKPGETDVNEYTRSSFGVSGKHMAPRSIGVACATSLPLVRGNSLFQGGTLGCDEAESSKHRRHQAGCEDTRRCLGTVQAGDEI